VLPLSGEDTNRNLESDFATNETPILA